MTTQLVPNFDGNLTTSDDGTSIGYLSIGAGPGLVVVHGSMQSAISQLDLGRLVASATGRPVHLLERRGRGRSGPYPAGITASGGTTAVEVADLLAVLAATGSRDVLGISSGALIAARAALATNAATSATVPAGSAPQCIPAGECRVNRLVLFEPALVVDRSLSLDFADRVVAELDRGDLPSAMVTAMLGAQMGPRWMAAVPRPLLRAMTARMLIADDSKELPPGGVHAREVAPNLRYDFAIVAEQAGRSADFAKLDAEVLLLCGTRTRPYLRAAVDRLAGVIPAASRVDLAGLSHSATQNRDSWGKPDEVAPFVSG